MREYNGDKPKTYSGNFLGLNDSTTTIMRRSASHAYEATNGPGSPFTSSVKYFVKRHNRTILATLAFLGVVAVLSSDSVQDTIRPHGPRLR